MTAMALMSVAMAEQMHQRAGQQEQIGQRQEKMTRVVPQQIGAERGERERNRPTERGPDEAMERIASHGREHRAANKTNPRYLYRAGKWLS